MQRRLHYPRRILPVSLVLLALAAFAALIAAGTASASPPASQPAQVAVPLTSSLVINEIYDSTNPQNEYIEIYNASITATVDLTSYVIYNKTEANGVSLAGLPTSLRLVGPGAHVCILARDFVPPRTTLVGNGFDTSDYLALTNVAQTPPVDIVNWGNPPQPSWFNYQRFAPYFFFSNIPLMPAVDGPRSLSRSPDGQDTDTGADWAQLLLSCGFTNPAATPTPGASPTPTAGCEDRYEPDDIQSQARLIEQNTEQVHTFCRSGGTIRDRDWLVFTAVGGKLYTMLTKDLTGPVDTIMTLFDAQGNALAENDDYGQGLASRIDYTFSASGTYFLQLRDSRSNGGLGYQYTVALISTGQTPPTVTGTATPTRDPSATVTPGPCYDAFEPDGVPETARTILIGTTQKHSICPVADADWVRFFALGGKVYTIRTSNLGVGLDSYMFLFDSDGQTLIARNDDGGDGVSSRIDFYPQEDGWYFAQIKNAGDIGGPEQVYDLSLAVQPGVPQPAGTATSIIAPPVQTTPGATATTIPPQPTRPPVPTPTQGQQVPTPTPRAAEPPPEPTVGEEPTTEEPTPVIPGIPPTGAKDLPPVKPVSEPAVVKPPEQPQPAINYAPVTFRVFYDANKNDKFENGEGINGIRVQFLQTEAGLSPAGELITTLVGSEPLSLPIAAHRVYVPYLGINIPLTRFPEREMHQFWLPPVQLPESVP